MWGSVREDGRLRRSDAVQSFVEFFKLCGRRGSRIRTALVAAPHSSLRDCGASGLDSHLGSWPVSHVSDVVMTHIYPVQSTTPWQKTLIATGLSSQDAQDEPRVSCPGASVIHSL